MGKKNEKLLNEVDATKRDLLRKILKGGAAVYVAPMIASFSLSSTFAGTAEALSGNQTTFLCHPILGSNQYGRSVFPTRWHLSHGDEIAPSAGHWGELCDPDPFG